MPSGEKTRILLVEDEAAIREGVCDVLAYHGFAPSAAATGDEGLEHALGGEFPLVILDVMLPGVSGLDICRKLRTEIPGQVILMLTAKGSEDDVIAGFRAGADDYVTKPFSPRELVARVKAVLRRARSGQSTSEDRLEFDVVTIDLGRREVFRNGELTDLTALQFDLLATLAESPGRVFSRGQLIERVWGWDFYGDERVVDVHIRNLRRALGDEAGDPEVVGTVRGVGYKLVATPS